MDMGTGKSRTLIDNFCMLHKANEVDALLLVAPKSVYSNWTRVSDEHPGELQKWLWEDVAKTAQTYTWVSGKSRKDKPGQISILDTTRQGIRVLAVNVEALSATDEASELCETFLRNAQMYDDHR